MIKITPVIHPRQLLIKRISTGSINKLFRDNKDLFVKNEEKLGLDLLKILIKPKHPISKEQYRQIINEAQRHLHNACPPMFKAID